MVNLMDRHKWSAQRLMDILHERGRCDKARWQKELWALRNLFVETDVLRCREVEIRERRLIRYVTSDDLIHKSEVLQRDTRIRGEYGLQNHGDGSMCSAPCSTPRTRDEEEVNDHVCRDDNEPVQLSASKWGHMKRGCITHWRQRDGCGSFVDWDTEEDVYFHRNDIRWLRGVGSQGGLLIHIFFIQYKTYRGSPPRMAQAGRTYMFSRPRSPKPPPGKAPDGFLKRSEGPQDGSRGPREGLRYL